MCRAKIETVTISLGIPSMETQTLHLSDEFLCLNTSDVKLKAQISLGVRRRTATAFHKELTYNTPRSFSLPFLSASLFSYATRDLCGQFDLKLVQFVEVRLVVHVFIHPTLRLMSCLTLISLWFLFDFLVNFLYFFVCKIIGCILFY